MSDALSTNRAAALPLPRPAVAPAAPGETAGSTGMSLAEGGRVAVASLLATKLRSILTMLGIIIGVAAVIALLAFGEGLQASVREQIQRNGSNLVTVQPGSQTSGGIGQGAGSAQTLTYEDAQALASSPTITAAAAISPEQNGRYQLQVGSANTNAQVIGVTPAYLTVHNASVASGDFITDGNVNGSASVVALGANLAATLFADGSDPVGKTVMINRQAFQVVGVMTAKGGGGFGSPDDQAFVPISTALSRLAGNRTQGSTTTGRVISSIAIQAIDDRSTDLVISQVTAILRERHRTAEGADDFRFFNQADLLASASQITTLITVFLGAVAGISLLVGGIGIMNIMLVSVTERTREIGIRKAIGARERDILGQFLIEAILLSLTGGVIGILLGVGVATVVNALGQRTAVVPWSIVLAAGVATATGVFFGFYPARRAARLNPIDALRYE
jgi:putative ABC transport system permease protein